MNKKRRDVWEERRDLRYKLEGLAPFSIDDLQQEIKRRKKIEAIPVPAELLALRDNAYEIEEYSPNCFYFGGQVYYSEDKKYSLFCLISKWDYLTGDMVEAYRGYPPLPFEFCDKSHLLLSPFE